MIALVLALLAAGVLTPLLLTFRSGKVLRGRRELALQLHRAQLVELDRDLAADRISAEDHATARLEIQRRILAAADAPPEADEVSNVPIPTEAGSVPQVRRRPSLLLTLALVLIPLGAASLYLIGGHPELPGEPLAARMAEADRRMSEEAQLIDRLRDRLTHLDPKSEQARQGYVLLGNVEDARGNLPAAAMAWKTAIGIRFDATLAAQTAEAITRIAGHLTPESEALFRQALAAAPPDAPWVSLVNQRLAQAK